MSDAEQHSARHSGPMCAELQARLYTGKSRSFIEQSLAIIGQYRRQKKGIEQRDQQLSHHPAISQGDPGKQLMLLQKSLELARETGVRWYIGDCFDSLSGT